MQINWEFVINGIRAWTISNGGASVNASVFDLDFPQSLHRECVSNVLR